MHTVGWLVWLGAAVTVVTATRNPLILILLLGEFALIIDMLLRLSKERAPVLSPWRFALLVIPVGALFNGLTSHFGQTVLVRLPAGIPLIGGDITAEALCYGGINGLVLSALVFAFAVLNLAVPVGELIQYVPRAFYPFAVVSAIAVSFIPTTLRQVQQVREAQAVRGHHMRGIKDWLPLFVPVLVGGLERALQLAESMTSRGFAGSPSLTKARNIIVPATSLMGLCLVLGGVVMRLLPTWASWSLLFLMLGVIFILGAMWQAGRDVKRTRYNQVKWTTKDSLVTVAALIAAVPALLMRAPFLDYNPYPVVSLPSFNLFLGMALLGFTVPVWLADKQKGDEVSG
jgi:energy-coupling factor transport system permease protein